MRLSLGRLGLPFARGGVWTPAKLASLGAYWWRADRGVTLREAGPDWPSQGSHARGLSFDGSTNYVDFGDNALYDNTAIAVSYTICVYLDAATSGNLKYVFGEGDYNGNSSSRLGMFSRNVATNLAFWLRDDAGVETIADGSDGEIAGAITDKAWNVVTWVLGPTTWGVVVNGEVKKSLSSAYTNPPSTTTFNRLFFGAAPLNGSAVIPSQCSIAYGMRHDSALTLAQCRQVQQYIAEQVAADGITLTIAGGESANANSPLNHWPFSEDAAGAEVADIAGSVTGERQPGDRVASWVDELRSSSLAQANTSLQPKFVLDSNGSPAVAYDGSNLLASAEASSAWRFLHDGTGSTVLVAVSPGLSANPNALLEMLATASFTNFQTGFVLHYDDRSALSFSNALRSLASNSATVSDILTEQDALTPQTLATALSKLSGTSHQAWANGGTATSGTTGALSSGDPTHTLRLGGSSGATFKGHFYDAVLVPSALDTDTLNKLLAYIERQYGVAYTEIT